MTTPLIIASEPATRATPVAMRAWCGPLIAGHLLSCDDKRPARNHPEYSESGNLVAAEQMGAGPH